MLSYIRQEVAVAVRGNVKRLSDFASVFLPASQLSVRYDLIKRWVVLWVSVAVRRFLQVSASDADCIHALSNP